MLILQADFSRAGVVHEALPSWVSSMLVSDNSSTAVLSSSTLQEETAQQLIFSKYE